MKLERTFDAELVRAVMAHPDVRPLIYDDGEPIVVPMHESIYHFAVKWERHADGAVEDVVGGTVSFVPMNSVTWNPHIALLPAHRGNGTAVMSEGIAWMFSNTACEKIVAFPPVFNKPMIRVFEKCGLRVEGYSRRSFRFRGLLHDRLLMGKENT